MGPSHFWLVSHSHVLSPIFHHRSFILCTSPCPRGSLPLLRGLKSPKPLCLYLIHRSYAASWLFLPTFAYSFFTHLTQAACTTYFCAKWCFSQFGWFWSFNAPSKFPHLNPPQVWLSLLFPPLYALVLGAFFLILKCILHLSQNSFIATHRGT